MRTPGVKYARSEAARTRKESITMNATAASTSHLETASSTSHLERALQTSLHPALRRLAVEESNGAIIITGRVSSYYLKQMAQEAVMPLRGACVLINRVAVERT
jgi:osmotically-inducible protein OsmY